MMDQHTTRVIRSAGERGTVLLGVLVLMAVAAVIVAGALNTSTANARAMYEAENRSVQYYRGEQTLGQAVSWLRSNSANLTSPFNRTNFYATFNRTAPTVGANDTTLFTVPTKIKMQGNSNNSVILTSSASLATGAFPATTNPTTGAAFAPLTQFAAGSFGSDLVRVTLVDAIAVDPTKDFGDTDLGNALPQTDFNPIYRVDSMRLTDRGAHVFSYVVGSLITNTGFGFYGENLTSLSQPCDSYVSNSGAYTSSSKRANCSVGSNGTIQIHQNTKIYGSAKTNGSFNTGNPYGGKVCADFTTNCPTAGSTCAGPTCGAQGMPTYQAWNVYCPSNQGNLAVNANTTLSVPGNAANQKCWNSVTVANNVTLTLNTTNYDYFIDTLNISNNSVLNIAPNPATGTVNLYVRSISGNSINGGQAFNAGNKPYQFRLHYLGSAALTLNGNSLFKAFIIAPNASVTFSGSNEFYGGIKALNLTATGSAGLHYDESGDVPVLSDSEYTVRSMVQRYR